MIPERSNIANEDGAILVIILMIMAVFSVIGVAATDSTITELQVVRNENIYKRNLYNAEAAAIEAVRQLETNNLEDNIPTYMLTYDSAVEGMEPPTDPADWTDATSIATETEVTAIPLGIDEQSSLALGGAQVHKYEVYGMNTEGNGQVIVGIGYNKPY